MKQPYTPLSITFQALSAGSVSSACTYQSNEAINSCPILIPEWNETVFTDATGCDWDASEACYHVPTASSNVFDS